MDRTTKTERLEHALRNIAELYCHSPLLHRDPLLIAVAMAEAAAKAVGGELVLDGPQYRPSWCGRRRPSAEHVRLKRRVKKFSKPRRQRSRKKCEAQIAIGSADTTTRTLLAVIKEVQAEAK